MTKEEAIEFGEMWLEINEDSKNSNTYNFFQMTLKALEQEPKIGHWIKMPLIEVGQSYSHECSECGRKILAMKENLSEFPYCHCGAKMVESQERSDEHADCD